MQWLASFNTHKKLPLSLCTAAAAGGGVTVPPSFGQRAPGTHEPPHRSGWHLFGAKMSPDVFGTNASFSVASWWGWPFTPFTADDIVLVKALRYVVPGAAPFFLGVEETMPAGCAHRRDRRTPAASRNIHASLPPRSGTLTASSQFKTEAAHAAGHGSTASSDAGRLLGCPASRDARNQPSRLALKLGRVCDLAIFDCSSCCRLCSGLNFIHNGMTCVTTSSRREAGSLPSRTTLKTAQLCVEQRRQSSKPLVPHQGCRGSFRRSRLPQVTNRHSLAVTART